MNATHDESGAGQGTRSGSAGVKGGGFPAWLRWTCGLGAAALGGLLVLAWLGGMPEEQRSVVGTSAAGVVTSAVFAAVLVVGAMLYLLPAWIARRRGHRNFAAVAVANVLLGWTGVGWALCLVWALMETQRTVGRV